MQKQLIITLILISIIDISPFYLFPEEGFEEFIMSRRNTLENFEGPRDNDNYCAENGMTIKHHIFPRNKIRVLLGKTINNLLDSYEKGEIPIETIRTRINEQIRKVCNDIGFDEFDHGLALDALYHDTLWIRQDIVCGPRDRGDDPGPKIDVPLLTNCSGIIGHKFSEIITELECRAETLEKMNENADINLGFNYILNEETQIKCKTDKKYEKLLKFAKKERNRLRPSGQLLRKIKDYVSFESVMAIFSKMTKFQHYCSCSWVRNCGNARTQFCVKKCHHVLF